MFKLFKYLKPYWWQVLLIMTATALQVYCTLRLPALMAEIINDGIVAQNPDLIWGIGLRMVGLAFVSAAGSLIASFFSARVGAFFSRDLRAEMFTKVLSFDMMNMKKYSTASLITRTTNDITQVQQTITMMLSLMLRAPLFCIISLIMAIQTAPDLSWIIIVSVIGIIATIAIVMSLVIPKFKIFQKIIDKITLLTRENLTGLRVIRAFNNEKTEQTKFRKTNTELTNLLIYIDKSLELMNPITSIFFNGATLLCYWAGIALLQQDYSYLGNMSAFAQYVTHVMMSFLMLSVLLVTIPRANVSAERINEVLKTEQKIKWKRKTNGVPNRTPAVEFKHVDFRYPDAEEKMLSDISFVAESGKTTAFIGSTGSGKSTLINLVPRFHEATAGEIIINGIDVKDYAKKELMSKIGYVPQRGILFSGTVRSNITFGAPNASEKDILDAARISQSKEFIEKLPLKYDAPIAQGGTNVSGGQKQRLSIARAICKNPDIFIFDDSFSALDMKTDKKLREALKPITKDSVVLIVAQRVSTIKDADQIVVLNEGKIMGKGSHTELLKSCQVYQEIVKSQFSDQEFKSELKAAGAKSLIIERGKQNA